MGPDALTEVSKAVAFPSLKVTSLAGNDVDLQQVVTSGKVTLVLTSFKNFGMNMLPAWREAFEAEFAGHERSVQTATLNIIEDWYMKLVQASITRGLKEKAPVATHDRTFAHFGRCDDVRTALDLYNSFTGYAHLVDAKGRIRWMYVTSIMCRYGYDWSVTSESLTWVVAHCSAAGEATPEELERLMRVTRQLLEQSAQTRRR